MAKEKKNNPGRIGIGKFWAWQSRGVSLAVNVLIVGYLSMYCTDALHINPGIVGTLLLASKVFDGFTDLFAGYLIDNTNSRWGKARPYELAILGVWLATWLLFSCPAEASTVVKCIWIFALYALVNSVFATLLNANGTPYMVRAFKTQEQFAKLNSFGGIVVMAVSMVVAIILPLAITAVATSPAGWSKLVAMFAVPMAFIGILRFLFVKETEEVESKVNDKINMKELISVLKYNKYIYPVVAMMLLFQFILGFNVASYYFKYVVGDLSVYSVMGSLSAVVLPIMFFFPLLMRKFSVAQITAGGAALGTVGGVIAFFANKSIPLLMIGGFMTSIATMAPSYLVALMLLDCGKYNQLNGLPRMDGTISAVNNFCSKLGNGIGTGIMGIALGMVGYNGELAVQSDSVVMALRLMYGMIPAVGYLLIVFMMRSYKLDKINRELEMKQGEKV